MDYTDFWRIIYIIDWGLFAIVAFTVLYITIFTITGLFSSHPNIPKANHQNRFIVLIPAYRADRTIMDTVMSVLGQTYPQRLFDITVISDHQDEMTNFRLAQSPITLLTPNFENSTKARSLQFAIKNLPQFKIYDVVVILDAGFPATDERCLPGFWNKSHTSPPSLQESRHSHCPHGRRV